MALCNTPLTMTKGNCTAILYGPTPFSESITLYCSYIELDMRCLLTGLSREGGSGKREKELRPTTGIMWAHSLRALIWTHKILPQRSADFNRRTANRNLVSPLRLLMFFQSYVSSTCL